jgi:hypothetical protein
MRLCFLFLVSAVVLGACKNKDRDNPALISPGSQVSLAMKDSSRFTTIQWLDSTSRDFGKISEGQKLEVSFRFKNTGNYPLVIGEVRPSCGCTVAEQPTAPVPAGGEGIIRASFNSEGHLGTNHKVLTVHANTSGEQFHRLQFAVEVLKGG